MMASMKRVGNGIESGLRMIRQGRTARFACRGSRGREANGSPTGTARQIMTLSSKSRYSHTASRNRHRRGHRVHIVARRAPQMYLDRLFKLMAEKQASDLFISCGAPISMKVNGVIAPLT